MKLNQKDLENDLLDLAHDPEGVTYSFLCDLFDATATQRMQIDRTLQKLRRAGKINWQREGKFVAWHAVPQHSVPATVAGQATV